MSTWRERGRRRRMMEKGTEGEEGKMVKKQESKSEEEASSPFI